MVEHVRSDRHATRRSETGHARRDATVHRPPPSSPCGLRSTGRQAGCDAGAGAAVRATLCRGRASRTQRRSRLAVSPGCAARTLMPPPGPAPASACPHPRVLSQPRRITCRITFRIASRITFRITSCVTSRVASHARRWGSGVGRRVGGCVRTALTHPSPHDPVRHRSTSRRTGPRGGRWAAPTTPQARRRGPSTSARSSRTCRPPSSHPPACDDDGKVAGSKIIRVDVRGGGGVLWKTATPGGAMVWVRSSPGGGAAAGSRPGFGGASTSLGWCPPPAGGHGRPANLLAGGWGWGWGWRGL